MKKASRQTTSKMAFTYQIYDELEGGNLRRGSISTLWSCLQHGPVQTVVVVCAGWGWPECPYCAKENYAGKITEAATAGG